MAFLGAGNIATAHLAAIRQLPGVEIVGVCDLDRNKAAFFQRDAGIPNSYGDVDLMIRESGPQIIHVLLPPTAHAAAAERCLKAGCHVFVEKPFCVTAEDCRRVERVAEQAGLKVGVNHNLAFMPGMVRLIDEIHNLRLGAIEHVSVVYSLPMPGLASGPSSHWMFGDAGRIMLEVGPHPVSIICRLLGSVQQASTAVSREITLTNGSRFYTNWQSSLVCERGTGNLFFSTGGGYSAATVQVVGQDGEAFVDLRRNTLRLSEKRRYIRVDDLVDGWSNGWSIVRQSMRNFASHALGSSGFGKPYLLQDLSVRNSLADFYRAVRGNHAPTVGAAQGGEVVEACHLIIDGAMRFVDERNMERNAERNTEGSAVAASR